MLQEALGEPICVNGSLFRCLANPLRLYAHFRCYLLHRTD
jgi:hypothetical protein